MAFEYEFVDLFYSYQTSDPAVWTSSSIDHCHTVYEFIYILDGDAEFVLENKRFPFQPGSLVLVAPGSHHHVHLLSSRRYERYVIRFSEYLIPMEIFPSVSRSEGIYDVRDTVLPQLFERFGEHERNVGGDEKTVKWLFRCVLTEIIVYFSKLSKEMNRSFSVMKEDIAVLLDYIDKNLESPLTLEDICGKFHYSKSYISREFTAAVGVPLIQYVRTKKIMYASALLRIGMPPTQVATQCGFTDYSTFYRMYKKITGKSPSGRTERKNGGGIRGEDAPESPL